MQNSAPLIAVVGCDGSGKSTVTQELQDWLNRQRPTITCHLGKQSGNVGRWIAGLPLMGRKLGKSIDARTRKAQGTKGPGLLAAVVIFGFTLRRQRRFSRMMRLRRQGQLIIADRFPQVARPGSMDGPGLHAAQAEGVIGRLAASENRMFAAMTAHVPDLVLRLNVSLPVAIARKPDHNPEALARKIADLSQLSYGSAPIVDIDTNEPLDRVLEKAKAAVCELLADREDWSVTA